MHVAELWRYPVKSLRGEALRSVDVLPDGFRGDRRCQVRTGDGSLLTARTKPALLGLSAVAGDGDMPVVEGVPWNSDGAIQAVREVAGDAARLEPSSERRFDETALLVGTDGAIAHIGLDGRRFRPNIVVGGVHGLDEREWQGRQLAIGDVLIDVDHLCERCVMTTIDPDTLELDPNVLRRINSDYGERFALNCNVAQPGRIALGDEVTLL
jgi:uncharacterized protein YcbX